jgi:PAS domain S-box-containing protein
MSSADHGTQVLSGAQWMRAEPMRYCFAVLIVVVAAILQFLLRRLGVCHLPYVLFLPAVVSVAILAGFWEGVVATLLATIVGGYPIFFLANSSEVRTPEDYAKPVLFAIVGTALAALTRSRNRADQALKESEADLNRAQAVAHIGSWRHDIQGKTLVLSDEACRILGLAAGTNATPERMIENLLPEDRESIRQNWATALTTGTLDAEKRVTVGRCIRWVHIQATIERDMGGRPQAAVGTIQDVTDRKRAEGALWESEDRYRDLVQHSEDLVCTHDLNGNLLTVNPAPARILGYSVEELLKIPMRELIIPEVRRISREA